MMNSWRMRKNIGRWMGAVGALLLCGAAQARQTTPAKNRVDSKGDSKAAVNTVFTEDPKMLRKVRVRCEGMAVGELLARLARQTGVELSADKSAAEEKVIVFTPARPLRETLSDLAALFDAVWKQDKSTAGRSRYVLTRSFRAAAREEALRKAANARLIAALDEQVKALAETPEQMAKRPAEDPIRKKLIDVEGTIDGLTRTATQVYAALTPAQREDLFARKWVNFPVGAINPQLAPDVHKLYQESIHFQNRFRRPEDKQPGEPVEAYERRGVQFALHSYSGKVTAAVQVYGNGSMRATMFADLDARKQWPLPSHGNPYSQSPLPRAVPLPDALQTQEAEREKSWIDRLRKLSEITAAPVLADFYRSKPVNPAPQETDSLPTDNTAAAKPEPANIAALDTLCRPDGYLWWTSGRNTLLLRKRDWYEQKQYEVSDSWLQTILARLNAQNNTPTLADVLRARDLTARQILGLNSLSASDGYSYSEVETAGTPELFAFLERELRGQAIYVKPLERGRVQNEAYKVEEANLATMQEAMQPFLSAQSRPLALADAKFFRVDISQSDRSPAPAEGFKDVEVTFDWSLGNGVSERQTVILPLTLPNDRRDKTQIEVE